MNLVRSSCGGDGKQDEQEIPVCPDCDDCNEEEDKESWSGAGEWKEDDEDDTELLVRCTPSAESPLPTIIKEIRNIPQTRFQSDSGCEAIG